MPTDENGGDANASQNQNQRVANGSQGGKTAPGRDSFLTDRDALMARIDAQVEEQRGVDDETFFQQGDPRAIALAAEMGRESRGLPTVADGAQGSEPSDESDRIQQDAGEGQDDPAVVQATRRVQVDTRGNDPLEEYVVRETGKPAMFKTVVDGKVHLVPLDKARAQLQKHLAADIRLQQATERTRSLDAREQSIRATEAQLQQRARQPAVAVDDAALERESTDLVRSLVSEPEAVAAKKLAKVLTGIRAAAPQIDVNALGKQAATLARQEIAAEDNVKALNSGFNEFTTAYPDIAADPDLFALADRKTNAIAAEHPGWTPGQVMDEAGRQTREWVAGISGKPVRRNPQGDSQLNNRQLVKQNLKPMPQSRSVRPAPAADLNEGTSASDALKEIRKSRGQAY